jgi:hypothetical protein
MAGVEELVDPTGDSAGPEFDHQRNDGVRSRAEHKPIARQVHLAWLHGEEVVAEKVPHWTAHGFGMSLASDHDVCLGRNTAQHNIVDGRRRSRLVATSSRRSPGQSACASAACPTSPIGRSPSPAATPLTPREFLFDRTRAQPAVAGVQAGIGPCGVGPDPGDRWRTSATAIRCGPRLSSRVGARTSSATPRLPRSESHSVPRRL